MNKKIITDFIALLIIMIPIFMLLWLIIHSVGVILNNAPNWIFALLISIWIALWMYDKGKSEKGMFK